MTGPAASRTLTLQLANRPAAIPEAAEKIAEFCRAERVPDAAIGHLNLALDEAMTNTFEHAWPGGGAHELALTLRVGSGALEAEISDDGVAFDPLKVPEPDLDADLEARGIGGLGIHFVKTLMDEVSYRREGGRNVLTLRKSFTVEGRRR